MNACYFRTRQLKDILAFKNGKSIKPGGIGKYPVYGSNGIIGGCDEYKEQNGIILGRVGAYCGSVSYHPSKFWASDNTIVVYPINTDYDVLFLSYLLRELNLNRWAGGAAQPLLTQTVIKQIEIQIPTISKQQKIAEILSNYDDLIENNQQRIKILEEMAQNLYNEWFVKFRFPDHQYTRFTDSPLGIIPDRWYWTKLKDVCDSINYGFTASANKEEVGPKFLRITDITSSAIDWESVPYCKVDQKLVKKYALSEGDIVVARTGATTGYAKRLNKRHPKSVFASYLVRIRPKAVLGKHYAGLIVESGKYKEFIKQNIGGAAQPQANAQVLTSIDILVPAADVIQAFDKLMQPLADNKELLQIKNRNLRSSRDLLLPKLISGKIKIEG